MADRKRKLYDGGDGDGYHVKDRSRKDEGRNRYRLSPDHRYSDESKHRHDSRNHNDRKSIEEHRNDFRRRRQSPQSSGRHIDNDERMQRYDRQSIRSPNSTKSRHRDLVKRSSDYSDDCKNENRDNRKRFSSRDNEERIEQRRQRDFQSNNNATGRQARKGQYNRRQKSDDEEHYEYGKSSTIATTDEAKDQSTKKPEPDFKVSGNLAKDTNTYKGVVIKYSEPPEARKPKTKWRLYVFKEDQTLPTIYIHRQSAFLLGRDRRVVDIPIDHPSCSSQHAALQYRLVDHENSEGAIGKKVKPYIIDLNSTNGTYVNNNKIEPSRYVELFEKDMLKFGYSSREYILLHENSQQVHDDSDAGAEAEVSDS